MFELAGHSSQREDEEDPRKVKEQNEAVKGLAVTYLGTGVGGQFFEGPYKEVRFLNWSLVYISLPEFL